MTHPFPHHFWKIETCLYRKMVLYTYMYIRMYVCMYVYVMYKYFWIYLNCLFFSTRLISLYKEFNSVIQSGVMKDHKVAAAVLAQGRTQALFST